MENGESTHAGALRETREEACANVELLDLYSLYNLPHINQVHLFFRANLLDLDFSSGAESLDVKLYSENDIPWKKLAFTPVMETLKHYFHDRNQDVFPMHCAEILIDPNTKQSTTRHF